MTTFVGRISGKTDFTAGDDTFTVANGEPIRVGGIVLSNLATALAEQITYTVRNGSDTIGEWSVPARNATPVHIEFIADAGLSIEATPLGGGSETNASVTVFHTHPGS